MSDVKPMTADEIETWRRRAYEEKRVNPRWEIDRRYIATIDAKDAEIARLNASLDSYDEAAIQTQAMYTDRCNEIAELRKQVETLRTSVVSDRRAAQSSGTRASRLG